MIILAAVEDGRRQTMREFADNFERAIHGDWERAKKRIFEELGQHRVPPQAVAGAGGLGPSSSTFAAGSTGAGAGAAGSSFDIHVDAGEGVVLNLV